MDQPGAVEARVELAQIQRHVAASDWRLISLLAMGVDYQAIATDFGRTAGSLRIRTLRIRQTLARLAA